jgi:hypothetical protein
VGWQYLGCAQLAVKDGHVCREGGGALGGAARRAPAPVVLDRLRRPLSPWNENPWLPPSLRIATVRVGADREAGDEQQAGARGDPQLASHEPALLLPRARRPHDRRKLGLVAVHAP